MDYNYQCHRQFIIVVVKSSSFVLSVVIAFIRQFFQLPQALKPVM